MPEAWFAQLVRASERGQDAGVSAASRELAKLGFHVCLIPQLKEKTSCTPTERSENHSDSQEDSWSAARPDRTPSETRPSGA